MRSEIKTAIIMVAIVAGAIAALSAYFSSIEEQPNPAISIQSDQEGVVGWNGPGRVPEPGRREA